MTTEPAVTPKTSLVAKLKVPAIILAVVAIEWALALMIMPSASPTPPVASALAAAEHHVDEAAAHEESHADAHDAAHDEAHGHGDKAKKESKDSGKHGDAHGGGHDAAASTAGPRLSDAEEVDLGNFTVSGFQPASNSTLFVSFHLYGTVKHKYVGEFERRMEENKHRIRDNIIIIIRSAELTDLTDAGLGLIKRRILETTNRTLAKPLLQEVIFSDFSFIEQ
jgi:flagellar basal body-associated protein FliL